MNYKGPGKCARNGCFLRDRPVGQLRVRPPPSAGHGNRIRVVALPDNIGGPSSGCGLRGGLTSLVGRNAPADTLRATYSAPSVRRLGS